ncbi:hypothetical protein VN97_g2778 [Penicillium thymicola]|uniref:Uncharacterized protein n=1 Tax=Penicillium thymicola TaxID=293382 RepID=A0AAI9TPK6_PENTH|nr:hypothetical protein VN97_g2778 [Penicillium thymicola]
MFSLDHLQDPFHFVRSLSPQVWNKIGIGAIAEARNASKLFPHPRPSFSYICNPQRGRRAPSKLRRTVQAATTLAACARKASTQICLNTHQYNDHPKTSSRIPNLGNNPMNHFICRPPVDKQTRRDG